MALETLKWQIATVEKAWPETRRVKSYRLAVPGFRRFRPGQHVDVRLTAADGYQAQRSYSIASAPGGRTIDITVELIADGEVSPYFHEALQAGDQIELRGPIGGPFTWTADRGGPLLLIGGGSGIVPLMSMLRHRAECTGKPVRAALLYSVREIDEVIYRDELEQVAASDPDFELTLTLTRRQPPGWSGNARRIDAQMLRELIDSLGTPALSYVCGSTGIVEAVASLLVDAGLPPQSVMTERFGPSS